MLFAYYFIHHNAVNIMCDEYKLEKSKNLLMCYVNHTACISIEDVERVDLTNRNKTKICM